MSKRTRRRGDQPTRDERRQLIEVKTGCDWVEPVQSFGVGAYASIVGSPGKRTKKNPFGFRTNT